MRTIEHYENEISECCKKYNIFTIEMVFSFYSGISRSQFYELGLNKSDTIKNILDDNKNRTKHSMLSKWHKSDNATLQMALMKLICSDDERKKLSMNHTDVTTNGRDIKSFNLPEYMRKDLEDGESEL